MFYFQNGGKESLQDPPHVFSVFNQSLCIYGTLHNRRRKLMSFLTRATLSIECNVHY